MSVDELFSAVKPYLPSYTMEIERLTGRQHTFSHRVIEGSDTIRLVFVSRGGSNTGVRLSVTRDVCTVRVLWRYSCAESYEISLGSISDPTVVLGGVPDCAWRGRPRRGNRQSPPLRGTSSGRSTERQPD
jgi:hypothetical protein